MPEIGRLKDRFAVFPAERGSAGCRSRPVQAEPSPGMRTPFQGAHDDSAGDMRDLGLALLRRGVDRRAAGQECCSRCRRTPLVGERVYADDDGSILCELCRSLEAQQPLSSRPVHGPEYGHTIKVIDQRAA
jgi:hypothetical protein